MIRIVLYLVALTLAFVLLDWACALEAERKVRCEEWQQEASLCAPRCSGEVKRARPLGCEPPSSGLSVVDRLVP